VQPTTLAARLAHGAVLAPMAGYTDAPFRRLASAFGAAWAVSEMVSARALAAGDPTGLAISAPFPGEEGVVVQLSASDPDDAARAAERVHATFAPTAIDLNMGCPAKKVHQKGCGADLMRDPQRAARIVRALCAAVPVPVTVKTRLGFEAVIVDEIADAVVEAGAALLAVHGRTAAQKYDGAADWAPIAALGARLGVPVIGSGDVRSAAEYARARAHGVGVMIARGALGRPWLFRELRGGAAPTRHEIAAIAYRHARDHVAWYGGEGALRRLRGQLAAYALADARASAPEATEEASTDPRRDGRGGLRDALVHVTTLGEVADAWAHFTGLDPRSDAVRAADPFRDDLPTSAWGGRA
jgi:tRNA-dihydrouridine synthase B